MVSLKAVKQKPLEQHSPDQHRPLAGYAILSGAFLSLCAAFGAWLRSSGHELPERIEPGDLAVLTVATHKASRLITKDRVTSAVRAPFTRFEGDEGQGEVSEAARGRGLQRAIGELLVCPYCVGLWIGSAFLAALVVAPRPTRWVAYAFTILTGSDVLQIAYKKAEDSL